MPAIPPRPSPCLVLAALVGCAAVLNACVSDRGDELAPTDAQRLYESWTLRTLDGNELASLIPHGAQPPRLTFTPDGKVTGNTGVNSLGSSLDLEALSNGRFVLGPIMSTRRAGAPELMAVESAFVEDLRKANSFAVNGTTLTLSRDAEALLTFTRNEKPGDSKPPK